MKLKKPTCVLMALMALMAVAGLGTAQAEVIPTPEQLIAETQKQSPGERDLSFVWWMPEIFWKSAMASSGLGSEDLEEILEVVRPYTILAVADGRLGPLGGVTFTPEEEVGKSVRLVDERGTLFTPLSEDEVSPDAINLVNAMKPGIASAAGPVGENMHFYFFPALNAFDEQIADPYEKGAFKVLVTGKSFDWDLPLSSVLEPKVCPEDGKSMSGTWSFCPWHGEPLEARAAVEETSAEEAPAVEDNPVPGDDGESEETEETSGEVQFSSDVVEGP